MRKFAKMSLVAAVAVAGMTTANAKDLTEAIKGVDVSGTVVYRYDETKNDTTANQTSSSSNNYKAAMNVKVPVNDMVKLNTRFITATGIATNGSFAGLNTQTTQDANPSLHLSQVNFAVTTGTTTVIAGKQGLGTPWTVATDSDSNEQTGTGILALSTVGPVTLAGAYFNQTNLNVSGDDIVAATGSEDVYTIGAMAKFGPVALDAWYLDMADVFDTYTVGAKASFDLDSVKLGVDARYTDLEVDNSTTDNSLAKITVSAKAGIFGGKIAYATTDKDGGLTALDDDAKTTIQAWSVNTTNKADADFYHINVNANVMPSLNIALNHASVDYKNGTVDTEDTETFAQFTYKMGKNLSTYFRYGVREVEASGATTTDYNRGRLQIQYSF